MLSKVNSTRFIIKKHKTIFIKNEMQFIKDNLIHERRNTTSKNIKLNMKEEVNKNIHFYLP